ncbi:MAG TPA: FtsX-like permease family protein [Bryobacteraceae bacterium]|jgi:putative ABC transport system permease protein|nr:FtsX-like permease family protein [Bryobacteraceae bacterium]
MFRYFSLAFKNSLRNRRRSLLTISSIAVSLCLLGVLIAIYHAMFYGQATPGAAIRLVTRHRVSLGQPIPASYEDKIRAVRGVKEISPWNWFGGTYKDSRDFKNFFARMGVKPKPFMTIRTQMEMPEDQRRAFIEDRTGCVISSDLAKKLNFKLGDRITLIGDIYPVTLELKVVGIYDDPDSENTLYFNIDYLREALPIARRSFDSTIAILAASPEDVPHIAKTVDDMFANASPPTKTESEQQFALSFLWFLGNIKLYLMSICGAVTFTILLVSGNTMAMSVRERIKEVGVLKTLGFTNDAILGMIIGEAMTIALIGGVIGLVMAAFLSVLVAHTAGSQGIGGLQHMSLTPGTALISLAVAAFIGLISSFVPAWNAARTNILDSLRYSG